MSTQTNQHRGRIQAQGGNFEASTSWSQANPPTVKEGKSLLARLINLIPKPEFLKRKKAFEKAEKFMEQAGVNGGVHAQVSKTFKMKNTKDVRVDIEIIKGKAFIEED